MDRYLGKVIQLDISHLLAEALVAIERIYLAEASLFGFMSIIKNKKLYAVNCKRRLNEAPLCCLCSRGRRRTPCRVPQPTFTPVSIYIARPSCGPLIAFA